MSRNAILVDYQYCTGCYSCEVACQAEHEFPLEQWGVMFMTTSHLLPNFVTSALNVALKGNCLVACFIAKQSAWNLAQ